MVYRSVVTAKGQATIPKPVRDRLGIHPRFASIAPRERPERWARVRQGVAADVARRAAGGRRG